MSRDPTNCVMCSRFKITGHDAQAAQGNGWCEGWDKYVPWNGQAGVLFKAARDEAPRRGFVEKHKNNETEAA